MKKIIMAAMLAALCIGLCSCNENGSTDVTSETTTSGDVQKKEDINPSDVTSAVLTEITVNSAVEKGIDDLDFYFSNLDTTQLEAVSYYMCASGAYPDEIAVFRFNSAEGAEQGKTAVEARLESQRTTYESYTPDEMYKFDDAVVTVYDKYVYYFITSNNSRASEIAESYFA